MKKFVRILLVLVAIILLVTQVAPVKEAVAQAGNYFMSLFVRQRLVMSADATTSTQSAEIYFEAGTADQGEYIYSSVDGDLDIVAATAVNIPSRLDNGEDFWDGAPSPANNDMTVGFYYTNDFVGEVLFPVGTGVANGWKSVGDATYDVLSAAGSLGGWCLLAPEGGSNNELYIQMGQIGSETFVECTSSSGKEWWLEFNLTPSSVTIAASWFVGLAEEGAAAAEFIADAGDDIADKDAILMGVWEGNPDNLVGIWQTATAAFDSALSVQVITAANMTLGFHFDGVTTLTYYFNGAAVATQAITTTGFPDTEELTPIIAMKQGASAININLDWVKLVAER